MPRAKTAKPQPLFQSGPFRISRRKDTGTLVITGRFDGKRYRVSAGKELQTAKQQMSDLMFQLRSGWRPGEIKDDEWAALARRLISRHKWGARRRKIPFDLTPRHIVRMLEESGYRCPLSGIAFSKRAPDPHDLYGLRDPWSPSIDRIDNRLGYTAENVRVVCVAANMAMNAWGYDVLLRLARGIVRNAAIAAVPEPEPATVTDNQPKTAISHC